MMSSGLRRTVVALLVCAGLVTAVHALWPAPAAADPPGKVQATPATPKPADKMATPQINLKPSTGGIDRFRGLLGYALLIGIGFAMSRKRKQIKWRPVAWGLGLQLIFATIVLNPVVGNFFFTVVDSGVKTLLSFSEKGTAFVLKSFMDYKVNLVTPGGEQAMVVVSGKDMIGPATLNLAFWVLPTVIFFSALITVLYYLGVMQIIVKGIARLMVYAMGTSGSETLSCTANIFVGQTEAPLMVKPFVDRMTKSELMAVMTGGFATVAGGVLALYVSILKDVPNIAGHLVTASIMAAPCALAMSKLMLPETEESATGGSVRLDIPKTDSNVIEAAARGASDGMSLVLNITAMLIAFVGLVAMLDAILGIAGLSISMILGWAFRPLAWTMGVPWDEAKIVGELLGVKLVLTELLAYQQLQARLAAPVAVLSTRSSVISSYALCGFANVASIGIQIGGIGGMAPKRRGDLARLGLFAMAAGALVSCLSGTIAGMFTS